MDVRIRLLFEDMASGPIGQAVAKTASAFGALKAGAASSIAGASASMSAFAGNTGTHMGTVVGAIGSGVGKVGQLMGDLVAHFKWASLFVGTAAAGVASSMVNMAGSLEQTRVGFQTLLKDEAKVRDALNFIQKWALETPFSVTEATDSFKRFLAVTGDLDKTKKSLQTLGDAVVATGGNINEFNNAARAMTQIQAMSKVRAQEMYQLVNANIPAFDILAKAVQDGALKIDGLNTSMSAASGPSKKLSTEFANATEKTKYLGEEIRIAEQKLKNYEGNSKIASTTIDSLKLSIQKKKDTMAAATAKIGEYNAATQKTTKTVNVQKMSLEEIKGKLQDIGELNISGAQAADVFQKYFEKAYGGAAKASTETLVGSLGVLKDKIVFAASALVGYNQLTGESYGLFAKLKELIGQVNNFLVQHKDAFEQIGRVLQNNQAVYAILGVTLGLLIGFLWGILVPVLLGGALFGALGLAIGTVIEKMGGLNAVIAMIKGAYDQFMITAGQVKQWFVEHQATLETIGIIILVTIIPALIRMGVQALVAGTQIAIAFAAEKIAGVWNFTMAIIEGIIQGYKFIGMIMLKIAQMAILTGAFIIHAVQVGIATAATIASTVAQWLAVAATFAWSAAVWLLNIALIVLTSPITLVILAIVALIAIGVLLIKNWDTVKAAASAVWGSIKATIAGVIDWAASAFKKFADGAFNWGKDAVSNFINGIKDMIKGLGNAGKAVLEKMGLGGLFLHGGIIPGPVGSPVPIIAHGGERVVPRTGMDVNGGTTNSNAVTVNFYGSVAMDSDERVQELADRIGRILGRQNELARYGAGF